MSTTFSPLRSGGQRPAAQGASKGTLAAAGVAALAAAGLGFTALQGGSTPAADSARSTAKVVVTARAIPRGTPLAGLAAQGALTTTTVGADDVSSGALTSPNALEDQIAKEDIPSGAQLTRAAIGPDTGSVTARLAAGQRAVTIPLDAAHGMAGELGAADRVDVYSSFQYTTKENPTPRPVLKLIAQDIRVLTPPAEPKATTTAAELAKITLGLTPKQATEVAFTADNGKVWIAARPAGSTATVAAPLVTLESLLFGVKPVIAVEEAGR